MGQKKKKKTKKKKNEKKAFLTALATAIRKDPTTPIRKHAY